MVWDDFVDRHFLLLIDLNESHPLYHVHTEFSIFKTRGLFYLFFSGSRYVSKNVSTFVSQIPTRCLQLK